MRKGVQVTCSYAPPSATDLSSLKDELGLTGNAMTELAGVASNSQWRKYTGGESPRAMSQHILFYMAAQLALSPDQLDLVLKKMVEIGAQIK